MTKKVMKVVDKEKGLMECLVCGARHTGVVKPESDGQLLPESWHCVNKCTLIEKDKTTTKKK
jgi:hypothetical protein